MAPQSAATAMEDELDHEEEELVEEEDDDDDEMVEGENDEMAVDDDPEKGKRRRRHRRSRHSLMEESGMTEVERRALRHAQRQVQNEIMEWNNHNNHTDSNNNRSKNGNDGNDDDDEDDNEDDDNNNIDTTTTTLNANLIQSIRAKNNALYKKVAFTREAVLDGENLDLLAKRAKEQVDRLVQVPRFDAQRLARSLKSRCSLQQHHHNTNHHNTNGGTALDWKTLGKEAGVCFNAVPSHVAFLNGPLQADYVPKPARQVHKRVPKQVEEEEEEEEKVEDVVKSAHQGKLSEVEHNIDQVKKILRKRCEQQYRETIAWLDRPEYAYLKETLTTEEINKWVGRHGQDICAIQFLFNPHSFTQTVENIFYFSFLVKGGMAEMLLRRDDDDEAAHPIAVALKDKRLPGPILRFRSRNKSRSNSPTNNGSSGSGESAPLPSSSAPARQAIVSLTMQSWRELCDTYEVTQGDLPHRSGYTNTPAAVAPRHAVGTTTVVSPTSHKRRGRHNDEDEVHEDEVHEEDEGDEEGEEGETGNQEIAEEDEEADEEEPVRAKSTRTSSRARHPPKKQKVRARHMEVDEGNDGSE